MALTRLGLNQSINLTSNVTGTLPVANGGTNLSSGFINGTTAVGKILQVVNQAYSTEVTRTSTSFGNTGIDATLTPSATNSKILVLMNCGQIEIGNSSTQGIDLELVRSVGASDTVIISQLQNNAGAFTNLNHAVYRTFTGHASCSYLDTPSTTSACQYRVNFKCYNTDTFVGVQMHSTTSTICLMEIGA